MNDIMPLRVAIIGMGGIGNLHAQCYRNDPLAELIAVCDLIKEKAENAGIKYGVPFFTSAKFMLDSLPEIDAVSVTTAGYDNGSQHFEPAMLALSYGKAVLVEKPLCADEEDARELVKYALRNKLCLGCNLNHYFTKTAAYAEKLIADGKVGEQFFAIMKMGSPGAMSRYSGSKSERWWTPYSHLKAFCIHPLSVMMHFCGEVDRVSAYLNKPGKRQMYSDPMFSLNSLHLRFKNGGTGYLATHRGDCMFGPNGWWSYEHVGSEGTFCIENCVEKVKYWNVTMAEQYIGKQTGVSEVEPETFDTGMKVFEDTFPIRIRAFLEDVTNKIPFDYIRASGREALGVMEVLFAAIKSDQNGGDAVIPEKLPPLHGDVSKLNY